MMPQHGLLHEFEAVCDTDWPCLVFQAHPQLLSLSLLLWCWCLDLILVDLPMTDCNMLSLGAAEITSATATTSYAKCFTDAVLWLGPTSLHCFQWYWFGAFLVYSKATRSRWDSFDKMISNDDRAMQW